MECVKKTKSHNLGWLVHGYNGEYLKMGHRGSLSGLMKSLMVWTNEFKRYPLTSKRKLQILKEGITADFFVF